ncbi:MAG: CRISPR-associated helicase Cas3' [Thermodesulfobacteriota bacterium]|nr:CRISPR-associated helicase Cas3' [Thermodesulfobacteriota bacterium]
MTYFGKPEQCYKCHIEAVYESWKRLYAQKEYVIRKLCRRYDISPERFKSASLITVAFHDGGKLSKRFQYEMAWNNWEQKENQGKKLFCRTCSRPLPILNKKGSPLYYRHEIIGGLIVSKLSSCFDDIYGKLGGNGFPFEFFAVIGHHKPVNPESFRREGDEFFGRPDELSQIGYTEDEWNHILEIARGLFEWEHIKLPQIKWEDIFRDNQNIIESVKEQIDTLPLKVQELVDEAGTTRVLGEVREIFALLKSLLIASDWEGSSGKQIHSPIRMSPQEFWDKVKAEVEKKPGARFQIKEFQEALGRLSGHGIAIAPTGSGKTEGSIAWAFNQLNTPNGLKGKILYVLPTQVLTNSIYKRLSVYFGEDKVGLLHSGALLYQVHSRVESDESEQYDPEELKPTEEERKIHYLNRMMFRPIMVATVDQLLMLAFNGNKRWSVVMGELMGGTVIFDEVHAFDGHMLALLERIAREMRDYTKILFMSATMPESLQGFLSSLLAMQGNEHIIEDRTLRSHTRNNFELRKKDLLKELLEKDKGDKKKNTENEIIREIRSCIKNKKRVAIVCNTVQTAQEVYKQVKSALTDLLNNEEILCIHSRFIAKDRREKEERLEKDKSKKREEQTCPRLLVSTQVIECGVDIDYDVLYTEGAPLEALIQRAGRINRERGEIPGDVYVYQQDKASEKFYPPEITKKALDVLKKEIDQTPLITEELFLEMIEVIYTGRKFEEDPRFLNTRRMLNELMYDIGAVHDLPETDLHTRFVTYKMVEVVPSQFWNDIKEQNQFVIMEHLVKMPLWAYLIKGHETNERWKIMDMQYDSEAGGTFTREPKNEVLFC